LTPGTINASPLEYGCDITTSVKCSDTAVLTNDDISHGGKTYTLEVIAWGTNTTGLGIEFTEFITNTFLTQFRGMTLYIGDYDFALPNPPGVELDAFSISGHLTQAVLTPGTAVTVRLHDPNASPPEEPTLAVSRATVNGRTLVLTYGAALNESSVPAASAFSVSVDRAETRHPESVSVSGREVRLRLAAAVLAGQGVRVSYRRPSANPIRGVDGTGAPSFGLRAVKNESAEGVPALPLAGVLALAVVLALGGLRRRRA